MSRFDKVENRAGSFRAPLNAALAASEVGKLKAVSINTSGRAVIGGAATTDLDGIVCPVRAMAAGEVIDVMTGGELAEATTTGGVAFTLGQRVYGHADGTVDATATAGKLMGKVVERVDRVVVRVPLT